MNNLGEAGHFLAKTFKVWQTLKVLIFTIDIQIIIFKAWG